MENLPLRSNACVGVAAPPIAEDDAGLIAPIFKALGDSVRLRLTALIASQDEICVCNLTPHFALSGPTISHHLRILREAGIIDSERRGTWVYYRIKPDALRALNEFLQDTLGV